jgi:hypothetical protein
MENLSCITSYLQSQKGEILVVGNELNDCLENIISEKILRTNDSNLKSVMNLLLANTQLKILRIGNDINAENTFNTYINFVSEGGLIIIDNPQRLLLENIVLDEKIPSKITHLGRFKSIYSNDQMCIIRRESIASDIKFAIVIASYWRKNGKSKAYVERCLKHIGIQSYQNYKVFLMGDRYEKAEEFDDFRKLLPSEKLEIINLPIAMERDNCKIGYNLWHIGGANAVNTGINTAVKQGYIYYVHLDDDDYWHCFHLRNMVMAYEQFPEAYFVTSMGFMHETAILPKITNGLEYNNFQCRHGETFHSSFGFRLDKFPFRYIQLDLNVPEVIFPPADAHMLGQINDSCRKNGYKVLAIPFITCFHDTQGTIFS